MKRIIIFILSIFLIQSCKKEVVPTLATSDIINITGTSATSGGIISDEGSGTIIARGVCWSTTITPTIADNKTSDGSGAGTFASNMLGLNGATSYYVRAYATNHFGTGYGMALAFKTSGQAPTASTQSATNFTANGAKLNGSINANYLSTIVSFEYGQTTSYGQTIVATQSPIEGNTNTSVTAEITGLIPGTIYHFRIKAVNSLGTTYGDDMQFTAGFIIGGNVNGGLIFYIDGTGQHGLICSPTDQSYGAIWGCSGTGLATETGIGFGNQNTLLIVNGCSTSGIAAKICNDLVLNSYSDWFLPSIDELALMYSNLKVNNLGGFAEASYWSSSQSGLHGAWRKDFSNGRQDYPSKTSSFYVRAVRAF